MKVATLLFILVALVGMTSCASKPEYRPSSNGEPPSFVELNPIGTAAVSACIVGLTISAIVVDPFIAIGILGCGAFAIVHEWEFPPEEAELPQPPSDIKPIKPNSTS